MSRINLNSVVTGIKAVFPDAVITLDSGHTHMSMHPEIIVNSGGFCYRETLHREYNENALVRTIVSNMAAYKADTAIKGCAR